MSKPGRTTGALWQAFQDRQPAWAARPATPAPAGPPEHDRCGWLPGAAGNVLNRRHAVREFAASAVPLPLVLGAIAAARDAEAAVWAPGQHGASSLDVLIAASDVDGLARGLHATRGTSTDLLSADSSRLDDLRAHYADAPALLLICADLNRACREAGPAGYPAALVRAGTAGYAAWLWSISAGLAGCVFGGASHDASGAARQRDPNVRHVFTVALGIPADPGRPGSPEPRP